MENMDKRKFRNGMIIYLLILIVAFILINRWMQSDKIEVTTTYSYTDLTEDLDDGKILALSIQPNAEIPTAIVQVQFTNGKTLAFYSTDVNDVVKIYNDYQASVDKYNATVSSDDDKKVVARCSLNDVEDEHMECDNSVCPCHDRHVLCHAAVREIITGRWRPDDELWQEQGENDRA